MKIAIFILLLFSIRATGQTATDTLVVEGTIKLRHIEGIRGFDFSTGVNRYGNQFSLGYAQYESENFIGRLVLNYEYGRINLTTYSTQYLFVEFNNTLYRVKKRVFLNLAYGVLAGQENSSSEVLNLKANTFEYGLLLGINAEIYLLNRLAVLIELKQIWDNGSGFGSFRYYGSAGFRFYL